MLTYKLNQDHLETFFSALRSKGGFNNNPNAKQFEGSYKRLLVRREIEASERGNCLIAGVQILYASSTIKSKVSDDLFTVDEVDDTPAERLFDHDYLSTLWTLSPYVGEVIKYISGFVIKKLVGKICVVCSSFLTSESTNSTLINLKN